MNVAVVYSHELAAYRFAGRHPLVPDRFTLAMDLMRAWDLLGTDVHEEGRVRVAPVTLPASDETLELVHTPSYIAYVRRVSRGEIASDGEHGIGFGDTPPFLGMHEAGALAVSATCLAVELVSSGSATRAFSPAGGLHHAQADRAEGFCIYNDVACAIEQLTRARPGTRVAYIDIDAHHGDGVEAAFVTRPDVLTVSIHESGRYLFPGTGREVDIGTADGTGYALNLPLPPYAGPECYALAFERAIAPALRAFGPDLIVLQLGADAHAGDPLTHLSQTVSGYFDLVGNLLALTDEITRSRVVMTGGGGYQPYSEVPRMWAGAAALALGREVPPELPAEWLQAAQHAAHAAQMPGPQTLYTREEATPDRTSEQIDTAITATEWMLGRVASASPLL